MSYFGHTSLAQLGISYVRLLHPGSSPAGWIAISKNHIGGIDHHPSEFTWAKKLAPTARIGKSILLYRVGRGS